MIRTKEIIRDAFWELLEENAAFDLPEFCEEICKTLAESAPHMMGRYPNE